MEDFHKVFHLAAATDAERFVAYFYIFISKCCLRLRKPNIRRVLNLMSDDVRPTY